MISNYAHTPALTLASEIIFVGKKGGMTANVGRLCVGGEFCIPSADNRSTIYKFKFIVYSVASLYSFSQK